MSVGSFSVLKQQAIAGEPRTVKNPELQSPIEFLPPYFYHCLRLADLNDLLT